MTEIPTDENLTVEVLASVLAELTADGHGKAKIVAYCPANLLGDRPVQLRCKGMVFMSNFGPAIGFRLVSE